jgi:hypothetical protein
MKLEKIHKTETGKFIIQISLSISSWAMEDNFMYSLFTSFIPNGKRKPESNKDRTDWLPEGVALQAKLDFWNKIKPTE